MVSSNLEQYSVADFLEWHDKKLLKLNPDFQRQSVWPTAAKTFLIDTILRRLPIPKIFMRTSVDVVTKRSFREVVDGQQRLRTIIDFSEDKITLGARAKEFSGKRYSTLDDDLKQQFLAYQIGVDQLINANDDDVLEVFARLNSYTVPLNAPELRHAKFQGEFKWAVHEASQRWKVLWEDLKVVSPRNRVRLVSDSVMAELFGIVLDGIRDGGQPQIDRIYERYDDEFDREKVESVLNEALPIIVNELAPAIEANPLHGAPHFLMLFAAVAHAIHGIPDGSLGEDMPKSRGRLAPYDEILQSLLELGDIISQDEPQGDEEAKAFWRASRSSTQRIRSRRVRFPVYLEAVQGH